MKNYMKFGLILCILPILSLSLMEITGNNQTFENPSWYQAVLQLGIPIIIIIWGLVTKKKERAGMISWKECVREGFKMSLVFGVISSFIFFAYYTYINPGIVSSITETYLLHNTAVTQVIAIDMMAQVLFALILGFVVSSIVGVFLQSKTIKYNS